jgi:hypothetical protein
MDPELSLSVGASSDDGECQSERRAPLRPSIWPNFSDPRIFGVEPFEAAFSNGVSRKSSHKNNALVGIIVLLLLFREATQY